MEEKKTLQERIDALEIAVLMLLNNLRCTAKIENIEVIKNIPKDIIDVIESIIIKRKV